MGGCKEKTKVNKDSHVPIFPQGTVQAQQMLINEEDKRHKLVEKAERERILREGGNPDEELLRRRRVEKLQRQHKEYGQRQKMREMEIVSRLLEEGKMQRRAERQMSKAHWHNRQQVGGPFNSFS